MVIPILGLDNDWLENLFLGKQAEMRVDTYIFIQVSEMKLH